VRTLNIVLVLVGRGLEHFEELREPGVVLAQQCNSEVGELPLAAIVAVRGSGCIQRNPSLMCTNLVSTWSSPIAMTEWLPPFILRARGSTAREPGGGGRRAGEPGALVVGVVASTEEPTDVSGCLEGRALVQLHR
jgi:hypothetical protein